MTQPSQAPVTSSVLMAFTFYLGVCGVSALFFPVSWLWVAGLSTTVSPESALVFGVLGAYLLSLAVGAWLAARNVRAHRGIVWVLLISQILDFLTTVSAVFDGALPRLQGTGFLVVTVVWGTLLGRIAYECCSIVEPQR